MKGRMFSNISVDN